MASTGGKNDKLSFGITLVIFGLLFLLDKVGFLAQIPIRYDFISVSCFFLVAGIVFVCTQPKSTMSWVFLAVGIFLNFNHLFGWLNQYSKFFIPVAVIIAGIALIFSYKR
ncbi:hypothetical protein [Dysgonomonas sp. 25]|uniref:LiaF transmembrane domain-containing protein n=1 Tax=Dysgonomonas sp. 25 TaxID=2302933 RepID=UPI0013D20E66|nr:hypothetical protein [Dysgonomonas sp. 25]NDV69524.1 hypothetical protein [Dysgonomonas sp. 25]